MPWTPTSEVLRAELIEPALNRPTIRATENGHQHLAADRYDPESITTDTIIHRMPICFFLLITTGSDMQSQPFTATVQGIASVLADTAAHG